MNHATLFSGIGGPEIAAERLGWKSIFTCEWESFPRKILEYHFPNTDHYGDITTFNAKKYRGQIDVLTGGFPCQPFSVAGTQKGATDDRYLWPEMLRVISECQPTWIIGENVAGIIPMAIQGAPSKVGSKGDLFGEDCSIYERREHGILEGICQDLEREGYEVWPVVIPAEAVCAPHRRDRIFIIGYNTRSDASYTNQDGRREGRSDGGRQNKDSSIRSNIHFESERSCEIESTSNTNEIRCNDGSNNRERGPLPYNQDGNASESEQEWSGWIGGTCETRSNADATNAHGKRQEREREQRISDEKRSRREERLGKLGNTQHRWEKFPTQSPICGGDDGLPNELDGITFSKWRRESIKAYGNAIVPEVIFRIYEGIDKISKEK